MKSGEGIGEVTGTERLYAYVIPYDNGFAPNPRGGYCTLACCKPRIRESVGNYVIEFFERLLVSELAGRSVGEQCPPLIEAGEVIKFKDSINEFMKSGNELSASVREELEKAEVGGDVDAWDHIKSGLLASGRSNGSSDIKGAFMTALEVADPAEAKNVEEKKGKTLGKGSSETGYQ